MEAIGERLWEGQKAAVPVVLYAYVLGFWLVWQCYGLMSEILYGHTIHYKRGKKCLNEKKNYLKKWHPVGLQCF